MSNSPKIILGVETSCDETAAAILKKEGQKITILSNIVASSAALQSKYGGIIPEQAAREQQKSIIPVIKEALTQAFPSYSLASHTPPPIDAIAVTSGPGLIGSLLVGVETIKTLSLVWQKPLIPVNHLIGHFYANWIDYGFEGWRQTGCPIEPPQQNDNVARRSDGAVRRQDPEKPTFPCLGLLVSGGHTDLVLFKNHSQYKYLGGTRDDAAGECFDKCARLLGLPYPGGPQISTLAKTGNPNSYHLPRPLSDSEDFDFSFSGLKTAVSNLTSNLPPLTSNLPDLCASIEQAIIDSLVKKTIAALKQTKVKQVILGGGVAANQKLTEELKLEIQNSNLDIDLLVPPPYLCTDNAAMITAAAFFLKPISPLKIQANPNLSLAY